MWDALSGEEELTLQHKHIVKSVNFSSDSAALATASNDKVLRIFDLEQPAEPIVKFEGHTSGIKQVMYTPDNRQLLSCSDDKTVRVWDTATGGEVRRVDMDAPIGGIELSTGGELLTVAAGSKVQFLDASTFEKVKEVTVACPVYSASLNKAQDIFVCGGEDLKLYKFDYQTGIEIDNFKGHFGPVHCVRFSPDGELYASGSEDGTLRLWQTEVASLLLISSSPPHLLISPSPLPRWVRRTACGSAWTQCPRTPQPPRRPWPPSRLVRGTAGCWILDDTRCYRVTQDTGHLKIWLSLRQSFSFHPVSLQPKIIPTPNVVLYYTIFTKLFIFKKQFFLMKIF